MTTPFLHKVPIVEDDGGVEEQKEEEEDGHMSPTSSMRNFSPYSPIEEYDEDDFDEQKDGFQAHVENFAKFLLGSCGSLLSSLSTGEACSPWPVSTNVASPRDAPSKPPLSIADELRKIAAQEGRVYQPYTGRRRADIPRFLGEEAVYSPEDDNISCISQRTLEEMATNGIRYPVRRIPSDFSESDSTPLPLKSISLSSGSTEKRQKKKGEKLRRQRKSKSNQECKTIEA